MHDVPGEVDVKRLRSPAAATTMSSSCLSVVVLATVGAQLLWLGSRLGSCSWVLRGMLCDEPSSLLRIKLRRECAVEAAVRWEQRRPAIVREVKQVARAALIARRVRRTVLRRPAAAPEALLAVAETVKLVRVSARPKLTRTSVRGDMREVSLSAGVEPEECIKPSIRRRVLGLEVAEVLRWSP